MAIPIKASPTDSAHQEEDEGALHFFARESQIFMTWTVRILLVITIFTMMTLWFWGIIPAMLLMLAGGLLMLINIVERRSDRHPRPVDPETGEVVAASVATAEDETTEESSSADEVSMPLLWHESKVVVIGLLAIAVLAVILAAVAFAGKNIILMVPFLIAYILIIAWPVWFAALEDDIEEETHRLEEHEAEGS